MENIRVKPIQIAFDSHGTHLIFQDKIVTIGYIIELEQCWSNTKKLAYLATDSSPHRCIGNISFQLMMISTTVT